MEFEKFEMPECKRIIVTNRKIELPVINVNGKNRPLLRILNGEVAEIIKPRCFTTYSLEPKKSLDFNSAWQFGGLIYRICGSANFSLALVKPEVIKEIGDKGYSEADKLRQFIYYENNEMFERAAGF